MPAIDTPMETRMKTPATLAAALLATAATAATTVHAADLTIDIGGSPGATVYVALYDSADGWLKAGRALQSLKAAPGERVVIAGLAPGRYAFTFFEDRNGNGQLDRNLFGIPTERYGMSRDATGTMGPPSFDAAAFELVGDATQKAALQ